MLVDARDRREIGSYDQEQAGAFRFQGADKNWESSMRQYIEESGGATDLGSIEVERRNDDENRSLMVGAGM